MVLWLLLQALQRHSRCIAIKLLTEVSCPAKTELRKRKMAEAKFGFWKARLIYMLYFVVLHQPPL